MSAPFIRNTSKLPTIKRDRPRRRPDGEAGQADFEHELITVDEDWHKNTGDAIAAQLRDAGIKVKAHRAPGLDVLVTTGRNIRCR